MNAKRLVALAVTAALLSPAWLTAGEGGNEKSKDGDSKKPALTCPVSGGPASKDVAVDYKGAKLYLCCPGCAGKIENETAKYAAKANFQLAASKQAKQVACPLTGRPVNAEVVLAVAGVDVGLCCKGCQGKMSKMPEEEQVQAAFSDEGFAKGFKVKKKKESEKEKDA